MTTVLVVENGCPYLGLLCPVVGGGVVVLAAEFGGKERCFPYCVIVESAGCC